MKLSTKIMISLILTGMVCTISLFAFVRCNSVHLSELNEVSQNMIEIPLNDANTLNMVINADSSKDNHYSLKFIDNVTFQECDTINAPRVVLSETFKDYIKTSAANDCLTITLDALPGLYNCEENTSILIQFPVNPDTINISLPEYIAARYESIKSDSLYITCNGGFINCFNNDTIQALTINNNSDISVKNSHIMSLSSCVRCDDSHFNINVKGTSAVDSLTLTGGGTSCDIYNIDPHDVYVIPDSGSSIKFTTSYKYDN